MCSSAVVPFSSTLKKYGDKTFNKIQNSRKSTIKKYSKFYVKFPMNSISSTSQRHKRNLLTHIRERFVFSGDPSFTEQKTAASYARTIQLNFSSIIQCTSKKSVKNSLENQPLFYKIIENCTSCQFFPELQNFGSHNKNSLEGINYNHNPTFDSM